MSLKYECKSFQLFYLIHSSVKSLENVDISKEDLDMNLKPYLYCSLKFRVDFFSISSSEIDDELSDKNLEYFKS